MTCPGCQNTLKNGDVFCSKCGAKIHPADPASSVAKVTCSACGAKLDIGQVFCPQCGNQQSRTADTEKPRNTAFTNKPLNTSGVDKNLKMAKFYAYFSFIPFYGIFAMIGTYTLLRRTKNSGHFETWHQKSYDENLKLLKISLAVQSVLIFIVLMAAMG